jgi:hypothetical protein
VARRLIQSAAVSLSAPVAGENVPHETLEPSVPPMSEVMRILSAIEQGDPQVGIASVACYGDS